MMKLKNLLEILDDLSPFERQAEWDNSGLCVGDLEAQIDAVYVSLDADLELLESLPEHTALIVHHPPIFKGLKNLSYHGYPNQLLIRAIQKDIAIIAMHTNYDLSHLNCYVLQEVLGYEVIEEEPFVLYFAVNESFESFAQKIKEKFELDQLSVVEANDYVKRAALTTGSGADLIATVAPKVECFLTGDIKYHAAKEAQEIGLSLIDIRHYESERYFAPSLKQLLQTKAIHAIIAHSKNPFRTI